MADIKVIIALRAGGAVGFLWVSLSGNTDFYISLRWLRSRPAFVKRRSGCGSLTLIETDWNVAVRALKSCSPVSDWGWCVRVALGWITVYYVWIQRQKLHVCVCCLQLRQTLSSVPEGSVRLCGWPPVAVGPVSRLGLHTKCLVALARWGCRIVLFSFLIVVPSYLLVHSICTKKTGLMSCSLPVLNELLSFLFLSAVTRLANVL